ncbi:restriction endonuclease subunit S [Hominisplanchenecus murintestinalis]|uniref:Restriction endonuclease subunit S n=2 Tax=Hominisplanchenecus murintestinalis TaxID=2941517 RepID=A0AC61QUP1_9FIRM|nr:restriction endonuclease subunit S [Hominisplanchenecus murintestinalis]
MRCIDEEIPFKLPNTWNWCRLKSICKKIIDGSHNPPKGSELKTQYIMASSRNIVNNMISDLGNARYLNKTDFVKENSRTNVSINDIFLTTVATLGRSCIYDGIPKNLCFQRSVTIISTYISPKYLKIFFDAPHFQDVIKNNAMGTAQKGFYLNQLEVTLVCVPPKTEQERIVNRIHQLLLHIQNVEKNLN